MSFANLLAAANAEAEELKKSQSDEGAEKKPRVNADGEDDDENDPDNGGTGGDLTKSFKFTLEDGTVVEAEDGSELVKSLIERVDESEGAVQQVLAATLDLVKSLRGTVTSQGEMIKSLQGQIQAAGNKGAGRRATISVNEKKPATELRKSVEEGHEGGGMDSSTFMAKCLDAQAAGKITGLDVARVESHLNHGTEVPTDIVSKVLAHSK